MSRNIGNVQGTIRFWELSRVENTNDSGLIVYSHMLGFYFKWPAKLFNPTLLACLDQPIPLDPDIGTASYAAPGFGVSTEECHDWIKYFVRITDDMLN
ncbi:hypothetical protein F4808DRAFT_411004 [Astrocystis sublimbata]|nr:hypothetical protein F4808DRAFT_411004 [Astrocystis sublimbata]